MKLRKILTAVKYLNLATIALGLSRKGSLRKYLGQSRLDYYGQKESGLPVVRFYDIFPKCQEDRGSIQIITEEKTGGLSALELQYISSIMKCYPIEGVFEIGTFDGCATAHMILNTSNPDKCQIMTLDLPEEHDDKYDYDPGNSVFLEQRRPGYYINKYVQKGVIQLWGDSQNFDFSPYYKKMDLVFIDGNHNLLYIKSDTENALKMLKSNGILLWHDYYGVPGEDISDYLNKLSQTVPVYRIAKTSLALYQKK